MEQNYIKVRPNVAAALGLDGSRVRFPDGCYNLYWHDLRKLGGWGDYPRLIEEVGGRVMTPSEVYAEQAGGLPSPLPTPTDPRWLPDAAGGGETEPGDPEDGGDNTDAEGEEGAGS